MTEPRTGSSAGSSAAATAPRRPWWIWALIALAVIVVLILLLVQCGSGGGAGDPDEAAVPAPSSAPAADPSAGAGADGSPSAPSAGTSGAPSAAPGAAPGAGTGSGGSLTAGQTALLPLAGAAGPSGELTALVGQPVTAQALPVQSVPADEGFWVGTDETDRVFVRLTVPPGESPYQVQPGQQVAFTGALAANDPGFAEQIGVDAAEGADQLTRQAAHIDVDKANLQLR